MAPVIIPASAQPRSNLSVILSSVGDMTDLQKPLADDIINLVAKANGIPLTGTQASLYAKRDALWALVFKHWTTNDNFQHPGKLAERKLVESAIIVGKFKVDHPPSDEAVKKAAKASTDGNVVLSKTAQGRKAGDPVWMRPNIKINEFSVAFQHLDGRSRTINTEYAEYYPGVTPESARQDSMVHWDRNEVYRVCT